MGAPAPGALISISAVASCSKPSKEVLDTLEGFGEKQAALEYTGLTVDPHQFLGIEVNPRAAVIADLVLWLGYLQWHLRTRPGETPQEPVLKNFHNIECRDAVLAYDRKEIVVDERGQPVTRWDGRTNKKHPVTGEDVPDETARMPLYRYVNARKAEWPEAEFIVGNPPYIGARRIRPTLGDEYIEALRQAYNDVPETCDYVMYWWHKAAQIVEARQAKCFGFITTKSIVQSYSRGLIDRHLSAKDGIAINFAVPNHPWVEATDGAAVRVAMMVGVSKPDYSGKAVLARVIDEANGAEAVILEKEDVDLIDATLKAAVGMEKVTPLKANENVCFQGVVPAGNGFKLEPEDLEKLGFEPNQLPSVIRRYIIGRDIVQRHQPKFIIDFNEMPEEEARNKWPVLYQRLIDRVKPDRQAKAGRTKDSDEYAMYWWIFAKPRPTMRQALAGLSRFIVTPYTAKHRPFIFVDGDTLPDAMAYAIASDDAYILGALSSRIHVKWSLAAGGRLGVGNRCSDKV